MKKITVIITSFALALSFSVSTPAFSKTTTYKAVAKKTIASKVIVTKHIIATTAQSSVINATNAKKVSTVKINKGVENTDLISIIESTPVDVVVDPIVVVSTSAPTVDSVVNPATASTATPVVAVPTPTATTTTISTPNGSVDVPTISTDNRTTLGATFSDAITANLDGTYSVSIYNSATPTPTGAPSIIQPFDPATGKPFTSLADANAYAINWYQDNVVNPPPAQAPTPTPVNTTPTITTASVVYSVNKNSDGTYTVTAVNQTTPNANGTPFLSQPFDPSTGKSFTSAADASTWASQFLSTSFTSVTTQ